MAIFVDEETAPANSRLTSIRLATLTLRLMENWRRRISDHESLMMLLAVVTITSDRLTRSDLPAELRKLERPFPAERLARSVERPEIRPSPRSGRQSSRQRNPRAGGKAQGRQLRIRHEQAGAGSGDQPGPVAELKPLDRPALAKVGARRHRQIGRPLSAGSRPCRKRRKEAAWCPADPLEESASGRDAGGPDQLLSTSTPNDFARAGRPPTKPWSTALNFHSPARS